MGLTEVLTWHYGLEVGESITSYITRFMKNNYISSTYFLSQMVYGHNTNRDRLECFQDYPCKNWGKFITLSMQSEEQLLKGTFYWLIKKFRPVNKWEGRYQQFLSDMISPNLRCCPLCLHEKSYYKLIWRFKITTGCSDHNVYLLDSCPNCTTKLKIFPKRPLIGKCCNCGFDLGSSKPEYLSEPDAINSKNITDDLIFLLTPHQPDEFLENGIPDIGLRFYYFRRNAGLSAEDVASKIALPVNDVYYLERSAYNGYMPGNFGHLHKFVDLIGIDFRTFFSHNIDKYLESNIIFRSRKSLIENSAGFNKDEVLDYRLKQAYSELIQNNQEVTQDAICEIVGMSKETIRKYPISRRFLAGIAKHELLSKRQTNREKLEREICSKVEKAINELKLITPSPSRKEIAEKSGYSLDYIRKFPLVCQLLEPYIQTKHQRHNSHAGEAKAKLLNKFYHVVENMNSQGITPDITTIVELCEASETYLRSFPEIRLYLADLASNRAERIEEKLYQSVKHTYEELKSANIYTGIMDICELLSISLSTLKKYIKVRRLIKEIENGEI